MNEARTRAEALLVEDQAAQAAGIELVDAAPGFARIAMTGRREMGNGHGILHGGWLFTLADTAFAVAFATRLDGGVSVHADVAFLHPGQVGHRIVATAIESLYEGRTGIYDVTVEDSDGLVLAVVRVHGRTARTVENA